MKPKYMRSFKDSKKSKKIFKKLHRLFNVLIMLTFIFNMSYLGMFFSVSDVGANSGGGAITYTLEGQKVNSSFTHGNICGGNDDCYAEGDSVPVRLTIENLTASSTYSMVVAHHYKNSSGVIGYEKFESPSSWNSSAGDLSFSNITVSADESEIEYTLNFTALTEGVQLKWFAVLGDNASKYSNGASLHFYLISGVNNENIEKDDKIGKKSVPINPKKLVVDGEPIVIDEPFCGDGIINQDEGLEQCDDEEFPDGYEEGFTCNSECQIEAVHPVCTLDEADYDHVVNLHNIKLVSNGMPGYASSTPAYDVSFVDDGTYSVTLQAHDAYYGRSGVAPQKNEQYKLVFFDEDGLLVATSSPHADLVPDNANYASTTEEVNTALQLIGVKTVSGVHAYYNTVDGAKSPNSVDAVCFGLNKVEEQEPFCGDGIINQAMGIEQCDGDAFPSDYEGYEDYFSCNQSCEIEVVDPQCSLNNSDFDHVIDLRSYLPSGYGSLFSSSVNRYKTNPVSLALDEGYYSITLEGYDLYQTRASTTPQLDEYYQLVFFSDVGGNNSVATSSSHADLKDNVKYASLVEKVESAMYISSSTNSLRAVHGAYLNKDSANSVVPLCAGIKEVRIDETPTCSLSEEDYDIILDFNGYKLISNQTLGKATSDPVYKNIPEGNYSVTLEAHDSYLGRNTVTQNDEKYHLAFYYDSNQIATSSANQDLQDKVVYAHEIEKVDDSLYISGANKVYAVHHAYNTVAGSEGPNSIDAVCAGLTLNEDDDEFVRWAEITSPYAGEIVLDGSVDLIAHLNDEDGDDTVDWAVRKGTCEVGGETVYGNVSGFDNPFTWNGYDFSSTASTSNWENGLYCFIFNPTESPGDAPIRETQEFYVFNVTPSFSHTNPQCLNVGSGVGINFINTSVGSEGGYNLMWNFGDNATSTQENPSHTYTAAGSYNVSLTLTSTSTSTSTPITATATTTVVIANCVPSGGGGGGGGGGGTITFSPGAGAGLISFAINNTQITMQCVDTKVNMNISWLTTNPATSRVVYSTSSHALGSIGSAPNYNYTNSTVLNPNNVTGHNVAINGLEPNTFYYFRPISVYNSTEHVGTEQPAQTLSCGPGLGPVIVLGEEGTPVMTIDSDFLVNFTNPGATGIDYRIVVKNNGDLPSYSTVLNSLLPQYITFQDGGTDSKLWNLGDIGVGETKIIMTKVNVSNQAPAKSYIAKATVYSANHDEISSQTDLDVRRIAVLAATGFSSLQFIALLSLIALIIGARIFLLKNKRRKPILVKKRI